MENNKPFLGSMIAYFKKSPLAKVAVIISVVLIAGLVFFLSRGGEESFSYLPDRDYILYEEEAEPQTLEDLLHSKLPSAESLLINPQLAKELLEAESINEIVDSNWSLSSLRDLNDQLDELAKDYQALLEDQGLNEEEVEEISQSGAEAYQLPSSDPKEDSPEVKAVLSKYEKGNPNIKQASLDKLVKTYEDIARLKNKTSSFLRPTSYDDLTVLTPEIEIKAIWEDGQVQLHIFPTGEWLPEDGFKLYRTNGNERVLLKEGIASPRNVLESDFKMENSDLIKELYKVATISQEDLTSFGLSQEEFRKAAYVADPEAQKKLISGEFDFDKYKETQITIASNPGYKVPDSDYDGQALLVQNRKENSHLTAGGRKSLLWRKILIEDSLGESLHPLALRLGSKGSLERALEALNAREQIASLCAVDDEFAELAGFLFKDDLEGLSFKEGDSINYLVEGDQDHKNIRLVIYGKETPLSPPRSFKGFGIDESVLLRWNPPENQEENEIISGYHIERKIKGESDFVKITSEPVVSAYSLDEVNLYIESPIHFEDPLDNGTEVQYRVYSIDIFGRQSPYSDILDIKVEKISPPTSPGLLAVVQSDPKAQDKENHQLIEEVISANKNKTGIVLPILSNSSDTVRFSIYRAEALGAKNFGQPELIADIAYDNPAALEPSLRDSGMKEEEDNKPLVKTDVKLSQNSFSITKKNKYKYLVLKEDSIENPDLVYFDGNVKEGTSYKYWISAWDSWNNESAWSQSAILGIATDKVPEIPKKIQIEMLSKELPDYSVIPAGVKLDALVPKGNFDKFKDQGVIAYRQYDTDTESIKDADSLTMGLGKSISTDFSPKLLTIELDTLPEEKYIHCFLAILGKDVYPNQTAYLKWPAYSGDGLGGYEVYRPMFSFSSLEEAKSLNRSELLQMGNWVKLNSEPLQENRYLVEGLDSGPEALHIFLITLKPEDTDGILEYKQKIRMEHDIDDYFEDIFEGGYVKLDWQHPEDPQIKFYRIYRSEVDNFKTPKEAKDLEWILVGDNVKDNTYTERVEQTHAHYYYYKVHSVTPWAVESQVGVMDKIRVPATKPPEAPGLLLPLSSKDGIEVNFTPVDYCERYEIYRAEIPKVSEELLDKFISNHETVSEILFKSPSEEDRYMTHFLSRDLGRNVYISQNATLNSINRFKTMDLRVDNIADKLNLVSEDIGLAAYSDIMEKLGPLALASYSDLSFQMAKEVEWIKLGEIPAASEDEIQAEGGVFYKPLSFKDESAKFGTTYLYTVQAWNDDNLGSLKPEPLEATPRRNRPFDPLTGLKAELKEGEIALSWDSPKMENLDWKQCREDTVGYILYHSDSENGEYYQASPLVFETNWTDSTASIYAPNWYRAKVLDKGGYLSDFSDPVFFKVEFKPIFKPIVPPEITLLEYPQVNFDESRYIITQGSSFSAPYSLKGSQPISLSLKAFENVWDITNISGTGAYRKVEVEGFWLNEEDQLVVAPNNISPGLYEISLTAKNDLGEDEDSFHLSVMEEERVEAPELQRRGDEFRLTMIKGYDFSELFYAYGTEPLTWSLKPISEKMSVPKEVSLDNGLLKIGPSIKAGNYSFYIQVENPAGSDRKEVFLTVEALPPISQIPEGNQETLAFNLGLNYEGQPLNLTTIALEPQLNLDIIAALEKRSIKCSEFLLTDIKIDRNDVPTLLGLSGSATLDIGAEEPIPVRFIGAFFNQELGSMVRGKVYIEEVLELDKTGITLSNLVVDAEEDSPSFVSGILQSTNEDSNLFGGFHSLEFEDEILNFGYIRVKKALPEFRYRQFTFFNRDGCIISLEPKTSGFTLLLGSETRLSMKCHLETLNNEGIFFDNSFFLSFDLEGKINGKINSQVEQSLQLLVPGGSALRISDISILFNDGEISNQSGFNGKLILPFEHGSAEGIGAPVSYVGGHPDENELDQLLESFKEGKDLTVIEKAKLIDSLIKYGRTVQQNGLLIVPSDLELQESCSSIPLNIREWDGRGFLVEETTITPTRITNRNLNMEDQRSQAIVVEAKTVKVDLDREAFIKIKDDGQGTIRTPKETQEDFWVGIIYDEGSLSLPESFIRTKSHKPIVFSLEPGEMLYDLNGFNYQNYLYSKAGVEAEFGEELGGFENVKVFDCLLDFYANRVNLEINAKVEVDLFQKNWVDVKLYTNQKSEDGEVGKFLCSVAPIEIEAALAEGIDLSISGGWVNPDGMLLNGSFDVIIKEIKNDDILSFSQLLIPANPQDAVKDEGKEKIYGTAALDKPINVDFEGFTMEVRALDIENILRDVPSIMGNPKESLNVFSLLGATEIAENIPLLEESKDRISIACYLDKTASKIPEVLYEDSLAVLEASFDECFEVEGALVPKSSDNQEGLVEYATDDLMLGFLSNLCPSVVKVESRFGYDLQMQRCYFALAMGVFDLPIEFGVGTLKDFTGVILYNMVVERDNLQRFVIPTKDNMKEYIANYQVHRESQSNFAGAISGTLEIFKLCQIQRLYFGFERGPIVDAGGDLYVPLDIGALIGDGDPYTEIGKAVIRYNHPDRHFAINMELSARLLIVSITGDLGLEYNPKVFGVYIGYPDMLRGQVGPYGVGVALVLRHEKGEDFYAMAKSEFFFDYDANIKIVFIRGYIYAGAEGSYYFDKKELSLGARLEGGISGGIKAKGKRFNIISFYLGAQGDMVSRAPFKSWDVSAKCKVSYHLNLYLCKISGSVNANISTTLKLPIVNSPGPHYYCQHTSTLLVA